MQLYGIWNKYLQFQGESDRFHQEHRLERLKFQELVREKHCTRGDK
jgi:hypothetical protein